MLLIHIAAQAYARAKTMEAKEKHYKKQEFYRWQLLGEMQTHKQAHI